MQRGVGIVLIVFGLNNRLETEVDSFFMFHILSILAPGITFMVRKKNRKMTDVEETEPNNNSVTGLF